MAAWGLVLNGIGALLIAYGQYRLGQSTQLWLMSLQQMAEEPGEFDVAVIRGVDRSFEKAIPLNAFCSSAGWALFVAGIVLQLIPVFREQGLAALF